VHYQAYVRGATSNAPGPSVHLVIHSVISATHTLNPISSNSTCSICCRFVVQQVARLVVKLWICCRVHNISTTSWHVEMLWICRKVVDLLYKLYSKSATNRTSGVWAIGKDSSPTTTQSSSAVTHCILAVPQFTYPEGMEGRLEPDSQSTETISLMLYLPDLSGRFLLATLSSCLRSMKLLSFRVRRRIAAMILRRRTLFSPVSGRWSRGSTLNADRAIRWELRRLHRKYIKTNSIEDRTAWTKADRKKHVDFQKFQSKAEERHEL
jgi:hypothetical protein